MSQNIFIIDECQRINTFCELPHLNACGYEFLHIKRGILPTNFPQSEKVSATLGREVAAFIMSVSTFYKTYIESQNYFKERNINSWHSFSKAVQSLIVIIFNCSHSIIPKLQFGNIYFFSSKYESNDPQVVWVSGKE